MKRLAKAVGIWKKNPVSTERAWKWILHTVIRYIIECGRPPANALLREMGDSVPVITSASGMCVGEVSNGNRVFWCGALHLCFFAAGLYYEKHYRCFCAAAKIPRSKILFNLPAVQHNKLRSIELAVCYYFQSVSGASVLVLDCTAAGQYRWSSHIGVLTGAIRKFDVVDRIFQKFGISKIHPIPTAWDYWFSNQKEEIWVIVTLIGGQKICGKYSYISFASSEPEERDLYLEEIYDVNERDEWTCKERTRGILIAKGQIATIEFISWGDISMFGSKKRSNRNRPSLEKRGYQPKMYEGYRPIKPIKSQPPNKGSSVQPAPTGKNSKWEDEQFFVLVKFNLRTQSGKSVSGLHFLWETDIICL